VPSSDTGDAEDTRPFRPFFPSRFFFSMNANGKYFCNRPDSSLVRKEFVAASYQSSLGIQ
jgi:hypothetical protein